MTHLEDIGKETYFENHGYTWDPKFECYVNKDEWKIFSKDYIEDHSFDMLLNDMQQASTPGRWNVYFDTESSVDIHNLHAHYGVKSGDVIK